jgi:hypothetical protein
MLRPHEIIRKDRMPVGIWMGLKMGIKMLALPLVPTALICLYRPLREHLIIQLLLESTAHTRIEPINPMHKAFVEGKQRKIKFQESEIFPATPYKTFTELKKSSKMKGRAERQLKGLEAAQKKEKSESKNN